MKTTSRKPKQPAAVAATKENLKGRARSYNYYFQRRPIFVVVAFILLSAAISIVWRLVTSRSRRVAAVANGNENYGKVANRPLHAIERGVQSTPLVMIRSSLDDDLLQRFLEEHLYSCPEKELQDVPGLDVRVHPPVYVYEGYYHSILQTDETIYSRNPNPLIGKDFDKPPASKFTRAFYDAFRFVNKEIFDRLKHNLLRASSYNKTGKEDVCYVLAKWIERDYHFGDLSIQIHYGQGNKEKLVSGMAWHTDAENSLLHLAVTLRGRRVLHSRRIRGNNAGGENSTLRGAGNDGRQQQQQQQRQPMVEVLEEQRPGDVYLSSSTLMRHAPEFFDTDYSTRVIAIHARFLYDSAGVDHFRNVRTKDSWDKMTNVLADTLAAADLRVPTLQQVESRLLLL